MFNKSLTTVLALSTLNLWAQTKTDIIIRRDGSRRDNRISIKTDQYDKVSFTMADRSGKTLDSRFSADSVVDIMYGDAPVEFQAARNLMESERYDVALQKLGTAESKPVSRSWFKLEIAYNKAVCNHKLGRYDQAIQFYDQVKKLNPKARLTPIALAQMGRCYLKQAKGADAAKAFDQLAQSDYSPIYKLIGALGKAQSRQLAEDGQDEALKGFEGLLSQFQAEELIEKLKDPRYKKILLQSRLGKGSALVKMKKQKEAEMWYEEVIRVSREEKYGEAEVFNARGDALLLTEQYLRALWDYQRVATVYFSNKEQHKYSISKCVEVFPLAGDERNAKRYAALLESAYGEIKTVQKIPQEPKEAATPAVEKPKEVAVALEDAPFYVAQKVQGNIVKGQSYAFIKISANWVNIIGPEDQNGWVRKDKVQIGKPQTAKKEEPKKEEPPAKMVTVIVEGAQIYDGNQKVFHTAKKGDKYPVVDESQKAAGWYGIQVTAGGKTVSGWISLQQVQ
jgi:tetratricopeptide (TPR) repeat protein